MDKIATIGSVDWEKFCKPLYIVNLPRSTKSEASKEEVEETEEVAVPVKQAVLAVTPPKSAIMEQVC